MERTGDNKKRVGAGVLAVLSGTAMAALFTLPGSGGGSGYAGIAAAALCLWLLVWKFDLLKLLLRPAGRPCAAAGAILTLLAIYYFQAYLRECLRSRFGSAAAAAGVASVAVALLAGPALYLLFSRLCRAALNAFTAWRRTADSVERVYVPVCSLLLLAGIVTVYQGTNLFYGRFPDGTVLPAGIYTSDAPVLLPSDAYLLPWHPENDLRQPLFGVLAMPFALLSHAADTALFFLHNEYPTVLQGLQSLLLPWTAVLVCRLTGARGAEKALLLAGFSLLYATLLFAPS